MGAFISGWRIPLFAFLVAIVPSAVVGASIISGPVVSPANGHSYYLLSTNTWTASEAEAVTLGGHLATVRNQAENDFIFDTFAGLLAPANNLWTGLYDPITNDGAAHASNFRWASGEPVVYTHWGAGEPNNIAAFGGEYYGDITIMPGGPLLARDWNDASNTGSGTSIFGVAEVVPEPSSVAAICLAAFAVLCKRRKRSIAQFVKVI